MIKSSAARARLWLWWGLTLVATTMALLPLRARLDKAQVALVFLLVVLGGSAAGGRLLGVTLSSAAFLLFNVVFLPPYGTLRVTDPFDWIVLVAFLITGIVAAQLLERQRREAEVARQRAAEIDRLAMLGAETLNAPRPADALRAIAEVIRETTHVDRCAIDLDDRATGSTARPQSVADLAGSTKASTLPARELRLALEIRGERVGTLILGSAHPFLLSREQRRVLDALSYYAALGVERLRLAGAQEEADALRRADRLKDALIASVSHDLRTPLTTIKGIADEIARGGDPTRAFVIEDEADRLSALVDDLLDLSQLTAGQMPVMPALNTADDAIGAALQRVESATSEHPVEVVFVTEWPMLVGRFDLAHTTRILANLLENAAKYAPPASPITVRAWREDAWLCMSVEDRGAGIPTAEREQAFQPFVRGRRVERGTRGTGLGLAIARQLAEVQEGRLDYEPDAGAQSRFVLRVPAADANASELFTEKSL